MGYELFDKNGNSVKQHDLQDKGPWCVSGETSEATFINKYGEKLGLILNPKKQYDFYTADFLNVNTNNLADLKTRNTPFFQAAERYSINPQYAVTFNIKDFLRYLKFYPGIEVYYWIDWLVTKLESKTDIEVTPMEGVWKITLDNIKLLSESAPIHTYQQRILDDRGSAKKSYVFDLSNPLFEKVI